MAEVHINLVVIRVADMDRSAQFYRLLGVDFTKHRHGKGVEHYASETGPVVFEIYPRQNEDAGLPGLRIGFQVTSVDEAVAALQDLGAVIVPRPKTRPGADAPLWTTRTGIVWNLQPVEAGSGVASTR